MEMRKQGSFLITENCRADLGFEPQHLDDFLDGFVCLFVLVDLRSCIHNVS